MSDSDASPSSSSFVLAQSTETAQAPYSLETAAQLAGLHADLLERYCRLGLLGEARMSEQSELIFDDGAIYEVRRIEYFHRQYGISLHALPVVLDLLREVERLHTELRFHRSK